MEMLRVFKMTNIPLLARFFKFKILPMECRKNGSCAIYEAVIILSFNVINAIIVTVFTDTFLHILLGKDSPNARYNFTYHTHS